MPRRLRIRDAAMALPVLLRCIGTAAIVSSAAQAAAQVSGTVSVVSDYRFRGVSLSKGHAEPQIQLGYDGSGGWYGGVFASGIDLRNEKSSGVQLQGYAGYARRAPSSAIGWDAGITGVALPGTAGYSYVETYAGINGDRLNGRLHFSPDYLGGRVRTLYLDVNGNHPLWRQLRLQGHVGYLHLLTEAAASTQYVQDGADASVGLAIATQSWSVQLEWAGKLRHRDTPPPYRYEADRDASHAWVLIATVAF